MFSAQLVALDDLGQAPSFDQCVGGDIRTLDQLGCQMDPVLVLMLRERGVRCLWDVVEG